MVIASADRRDRAEQAAAFVAAGAFVAIDHVGSVDDAYLTDAERVGLVRRLITAGRVDRIVLSSGSVGVAKGFDAPAADYAAVLTTFVPALRDSGVSDDDITRILTDNPRDLLARVEA
ncbi:phosphotriesterase family protein [Microbacterium gorillae]|uniref:phosphotriesterase family protein n=1 Tax=Microbacterium gorillae TaxID=1231063 RepID=UPI000B2BF6AF|nr:hypothetical protein [Microbacterium gorillae]